MKDRLSIEFAYQLAALLLSIIIVHSTYVGVVRPQARSAVAANQAEIAANPDAIPERSVWIIVRDYEQEVCFILMLWAMALLAFKANNVQKERALLGGDLIPLTAGESILPEDTRDVARTIEGLPAPERDFLYARALLTALHRFRSTRNIQDVSESVNRVCESESDHLDSELSMIRYIAWAIPSIGFIGTVPRDWKRPPASPTRRCRETSAASRRALG